MVSQFAALLWSLVALSVASNVAKAQSGMPRLGLIGLDTSNVIACTAWSKNPVNKSGGRGVAEYRGARRANFGEGVLVFGSERPYQAGRACGNPVLCRQTVSFFNTGNSPASAEETKGIFALMSMADESQALGGAPRLAQAVPDRAQKDVDSRQAPKTRLSAGDKKLRIVFAGAHCDDNELGAGGLMRILADQGHEVISAYGTTFRRGRLVGGKPEDEVRRAESTRACEILGARPHFFPFAHEDLEGPFADRPTLTAMVNWINQVHPDIVVTHWPLDTHPNHHSVAAAVMMAYKHSDRVWGKEGQIAAARSKGWNLYFYEVNNFTDWDDIETLGFRPELYLNVGSVVDAKRQASNCFVSQTAYKPWEVQEKMHLVRGKECGVRRAEAYVLLEAKPDCPRLPVEFSKRK